MNKQHRVALRVAARTHDRLHKIPGTNVSLPEEAWLQCQRLARQIAKAKQHHWHRAARRLKPQLEGTLGCCRRRLEKIESQLRTVTSAGPSSSPREIFADLLALEREFSAVRYKLSHSTITAETHFISLQGVELGRFEIVLNWNSLDEPRYEVVALDPNPAACSSNTMHPHVQDDRLCEGDGRAAIQRAMEQGHIFDFFVLVQQILETYNPSSAHASLENWHGVECRDCGYTADADDRMSCDRCDREICGDCVIRCMRCGEPNCSQCSEACQGCDDYFCGGCLQSCAACDDHFCQECLTDEKCAACRQRGKESQEAEAEDDAQSEAAETASPDAPLHAVRLGEAAISA